jgi:hypothetical protein
MSYYYPNAGRGTSYYDLDEAPEVALTATDTGVY